MIMDDVESESHRDPESIERIRRVPFVKALSLERSGAAGDPNFDGVLEIETPRGRFPLAVQTKHSLPRDAVGNFIAWVNHLRTLKSQGIMLLTRHVPRHAAEALIAANVNFADDSGNIHLALGDAYHWTAIGAQAPGPISKRRPVSPAVLQLLFQFAADPDSVNWPVRQLEAAAGISKSKAAQARQQLEAAGVIRRAGKQYRLGPTQSVADYLVQGYGQVLRPKLTIGTYRAPEKLAEDFLSRLRQEAPSSIRYALTGGQAARLLQNYYRGPEVTVFVEPSTGGTAKQLRLLPDRQGSVTLLKAFGETVFWQVRDGLQLAPPWLIYAELLNSKDPRAHEAATEFRREFIVDANE